MQALELPDYYRLTLEDGSAIPPDVIADLKDVTERMTVPIEWQPGQFALIDNTRILHGREAFDDPDRKILARHAMAVF
jgi:alpha-ketoglutarate-dependent taurine dioxygenase